MYTKAFFTLEKEEIPPYRYFNHEAYDNDRNDENQTELEMLIKFAIY